MCAHAVALLIGRRRKIQKGEEVSPGNIPCAGSIWVIATGIFASTLINPTGPNGALFGDSHQLLLEGFAVAVVSALAFIASYFLLKVIGLVTPFRASSEEEELGLDQAEHSEDAYT